MLLLLSIYLMQLRVRVRARMHMCECLNVRECICFGMRVNVCERVCV